MSMRYKGSRLSATANTPTSLTASGAWTLQQQMQANGTSTWPFVRDPQFNYVTMLLHGDGSAGANNGSGGGATPTVTAFNTDASTNNFNLTINGDARSNNFNPYQSGYYSNYFDGSGDYLTAGSSISLSGDFTIEGWIYPTASPVNNYYFFGLGNDYFSTGATFSVTSGGYLRVYTANANILSGTSAAAQSNTWSHVAFVRSGTTLKAYLNGVQVDSATLSGTISGTAYINAELNGNPSATVYPGNSGYFSNFRVGTTAVYTTAFTPSTTPLTAITGTQLLTCQSNRFIDNSTNAYTITKNGDTAVSPAQPFTLPSSVATYGSGYFDGTGDKLITPASSAFNFGTGDFTIEMWVYPNATIPTYGDAFFLMDSRTNASWSVFLSSGKLYFSNSSGTENNGGTIASFTWSHVAVSRVSGTTKGFINGVQAFSFSDSGNYTSSPSLTIGARYITTGTTDLNGYLSNVRIINGTGLYTSAFTPPTSPLTAVSGTSLLTTQYNGGGNNSGFKDSSQNNFVITRNGNSTQGTFTPYGSNWSNYFDGVNNSVLTQNSSTNWNFLHNGSSWTIEFFVFPTNTNTTVIASTVKLTANKGFSLQINSAVANDVGFYFFNGTTIASFSSTANLVQNQWNHVGITFETSTKTCTFYINGVQRGSSSNTGFSYSTSNSTYGLTIGAEASSYLYDFTGYLSNLRISTVVRSGMTTVPTTPYTNDANTSLLTCQSNRFVDNSSNAYTLDINGSPSVQRFSPFANATAYNPATTGGSAYFDGTGDYLVTSSAGGFNPRSTFTIDFWTYPISNNTITWINSNTNNSFYFETAGTTLYVGDGLNNTIGTSAPTVNQWTHLLLSFDGTTYRLFYNGVLQASSTTLLQSAVITAFRIGQKQDGTRDFNGYITDMRVFVGTALYTAAFTPPTAPVTPTANTTLLLSTTNSAILDQSMMNDLETVGNAQISTSVVKYGTASIAFDGTGDYLRPNSQLPFVFNTGDFTIEFWVYANSVSGWLTFFDNRPSTTGSGFFLGYNSGFQYYSGSSNLISGGTLSTSTWTHVALCRASGSVRIFVNGTQVGSTATDTSNYSSSTVLANGPFIGSNYVPSDFLNGYLDDFRVTKYARYTTTFTPPTQALPNG